MSAAQVLPLAREGFRLFPVKAKDKRPEIADWPNEASDNPQRIEFWAKRWPGCNWGLACGAGSGLFAVDFDGDQGRAVLNDWFKEHGTDWAQTRAVKTFRGGHLWFRWPAGETQIRNSTGRIAPGVDVRGEGGFIIIPPSIHPAGTAYTWAAKPSMPIAEGPRWLIEGILRAAGPQPFTQIDGNGRGKIPEGQRNDSLASLAGSMRRRGLESEAILAALLRHNTARCAPPLREAEVRQIAESVGRYEPAESAEARLFTEDELALLFTSRHPNLRYTAEWRKWHVATDQKWEEDKTRQVFSLSREVCRDAGKEVENNGTAKRLGSAKTRWAVVDMAQDHREHAMGADQWDADAWILNTPGGIVDLRTGGRRPFIPAQDYITKVTSVAPADFLQENSLWRSFLRRVTANDPDMQSFLQRVAGYCLTGAISEEALFFFYGGGMNGKSKFLGALSGVLHEYHRVAPITALMATTQETHPTELAGLHAARLVTAIETEGGKRWAESKIKALTGGDPLTARFMRGDFFDFIPKFKILVAANHKPGLRNVDVAMKRRLHLIPFTVEIPPEERDPNLAQKLSAEGDQILRWAIDGCLMWQREGLNPPLVVTAATQEYFESQDAVGRWLEECCELGVNFRTTKKELFQCWSIWSERAKEYTGAQRNFTEELQRRGFQLGGDGRMYLLGLRIPAERLGGGSSVG